MINSHSHICFLLFFLPLFSCTFSTGPIPPDTIPVSIPRPASEVIPFFNLKQDLNCSASPSPCKPFNCCPRGCCPNSEPFCSPKGGFCVNAKGKLKCKDKISGNVFFGKPCDPVPNTCCGFNPGFGRCSVYQGNTVCTNSDGFIACGEQLIPGELCSLTSCCPISRKCCTSSEGTLQCCLEGGGDPLDVFPIVNSEPVFMPEQTLEPSMHPDPTPGIEAGGVSPTGEAQDQDDDDGSVCFPGSATVEVRGVGFVTMGEVKMGDWVRVGENQFSRVFMWTHKNEIWKGTRYVTVQMESGESMTATTGHMVWVWKCRTNHCARESVDVEKVMVGQGMWVIGKGVKRVVRVSWGWGQGLYNPQTESGDIVVDGVLVSCYTKYVPMEIAHGALAPLRAAWRGAEALMTVFS